MTENEYSTIQSALSRHLDRFLTMNKMLNEREKQRYIDAVLSCKSVIHQWYNYHNK